MRVAQQLYEGVDTGGGAVGLITYMRTDSVNLAAEAVDDIRETSPSDTAPTSSQDPHRNKHPREECPGSARGHTAHRCRAIPEELKAHLTADQTGSTS